MADLPAVYACPKCASNNILTIDIADPPMLFECASCCNRFHRFGFSPSEVETKTGLAQSQQLVLDSFLKR